MINSNTVIHITNGAKKMQNIPSVNTNSLTNEFCKINSLNKSSVCNKCYSNRLLKYRKLLNNKLYSNDDILSTRLLEDHEIPVFNNKYVRFNSFGEIINHLHYQNLLLIAKKNYNVTFGLWTKRHNIISKYPKMDNIRYVYSVNKINGKIPSKSILDFYDRIFIVNTSDKDVIINCNKECMSCLICYSDRDKGPKIIRELIK